MSDRLCQQGYFLAMTYLRQSRLYFAGPAAAGMLLLRAYVGFAFLLHGWRKIQTPFAWMNLPGKPSHVPGFLQALAACSEFLGGGALLVGFFTPVACLGLMATMATAVFLGWRGHQPFLYPAKGSLEPAACYFFIALSVLIQGPGVLSLDSDFFGTATPKGRKKP